MNPIGRIAGGVPAILIAQIVYLAALSPVCLADFDVNAVAGRVLIDGRPAAPGTVVVVEIQDSGRVFSTLVDGDNIAPFAMGQGRYDTGDLPELSTGQVVTVGLEDRPDTEAAVVVLNGGTTVADVNVGSKSVEIVPNEEERSISVVSERETGEQIASQGVIGIIEMILDRILEILLIAVQGSEDAIQSINENIEEALEVGTEKTGIAANFLGPSPAEIAERTELHLVVFSVSVSGLVAFLVLYSKARYDSRKHLRRPEEEISLSGPPFWDPI